jgi:hypothetical protein
MPRYLASSTERRPELEGGLRKKHNLVVPANNEFYRQFVLFVTLFTFCRPHDRDTCFHLQQRPERCQIPTQGSLYLPSFQ